jgi:glycosyltransferase involved in cell wall biosynthesis
MDVMLLTSDMEGLPMIVLEAMTLKVSVVSHAIGSIAQVLDQGRVGTLVHKQDPEAYAEAIISCLKSERLRKEKCEAAYERIRQTYSIDSTCLKYMRVYESVVKDCRDGYAGLRSGI